MSTTTQPLPSSMTSDAGFLKFSVRPPEPFPWNAFYTKRCLLTADNVTFQKAFVKFLRACPLGGWDAHNLQGGIRGIDPRSSSRQQHLCECCIPLRPGASTMLFLGSLRARRQAVS